MSVQQRNLEALVHFPLAPTAVRSTTFTGETTNIADLRALDGDIQIMLDSSVVTGAGSITCTIEHSNTTTGGDFVAIVPAAAFTAVTSAGASKQILTLPKDDLRRYIRVVGTVSGTASAAYGVNGYGVAKYQ